MSFWTLLNLLSSADGGGSIMLKQVVPVVAEEAGKLVVVTVYVYHY